MSVITIQNTIKTDLLNFKTFIQLHSFWFVIVAICMSVLCIFWIIFSIRFNKQTQKRWKQSLHISQRLMPENGLEQNLIDLLEMVEPMVEAPTYVFYLYDESKKTFVLKAVRHRTHNFGKVEPSYSGLVEYKREQYLPPLSIPADQSTQWLKVQKVGEVLLLNIPISDLQGLIRIGPMNSGKMNKKTELEIHDFSATIQNMLHQLISIEHIRTKSNIIISTSQALQRINSIAFDPKITLDFIFKLMIKVIGATGALFVEKREKDYHLIAVSDEEHSMPSGISFEDSDQDILQMLKLKGDHQDIRLIVQSDDLYYQIPPRIAATGAEAYAIVDISERRELPNSRMFILWFTHEPGQSMWNEAQKTLDILVGNMREVLGYQQTLKKYSGSYINILRTLSQLQDNLMPHTVGYSDLISQYAIVIAKELGLDDDLIRDVALAAYLSNIGLIGISSNLTNTEGKYSDEEYELMKLHSEVGASIVQSTLGNERVSHYILHHHERIDGNGYPSGLAGDEIPIGSRIIAVVQTFLAQINGRKYRSPLTFEQAMHSLELSAGSQLDEEIVVKFLDWFKKKQADPIVHGRSLGVCWEMCCTPSSICQNCPAFKQTDRNCWEFETNNCKSHGKECSTCFVRTETLSRKGANVH